MKITRNVWAALGLAALAFAAGRMNLFTNTDAYASAQDQPPEMDESMLAYLAAGAPGEHHKQLKALIGEWEGVFRIWMEPGGPPIESVGTIKREWVLGGRYVREQVHATSDGMEFNGLGYIGYNNLDGQYEIIWMDTMSTAITSWSGSYNPETKIFTSHGSYRDPVTGKVSLSRGVMDMSNPNRHVSSDYTTGPDGIERKTMEGVAERIMKKK